MGSFVNPNDKVEIVETEDEMRLNDNPDEKKTPRVVTIRAKMDYATTKQVQGVAVRMGKGGGDTEFNIGDSLMELLIRNILSWRGGDLEGAPCTSENIRQLNPTDPFIDRVANEIGERNRGKPSPNQRSVEPNGSTSGGSTASNTRPDEAPSLSLLSGNGTPKLSSPRNSDGVLK